MVHALSVTAAPTILCLPGNMCDARMWHGVLPDHERRRVEYPVLSQDTISQMAEHCLSNYPGMLLPVGFSMGAIVALAIADIAPERVTAIGLIDVNAGPDRPENATKRPRQQREVLDGDLDRVVMHELKPGYFAAANRDDEGMRSLVLEMARQLGPDVFVAQSEALRTRSDYRHVLAELGKPVFLACGDEDSLCPPALHQELATQADKAQLHIVKRAGHLLPIERPAELGALLSAWLDRVEKEVSWQTES